MSTTRFDAGPARPTPLPALPVPGGSPLRLCASPHCHNLVLDAWEETGTLCASCAVEHDLADREGRWDRLGDTVH